MSSTATPTASGGHTKTIVITALALFSMFFGAGNLIFPPMLAVQALSLIHISEPTRRPG